jgi:hypothetical protein
LGGEVLHQLHLLVGERLHLGARQYNHADGDAFTQERGAKYAAISLNSLLLDRSGARVG